MLKSLLALIADDAYRTPQALAEALAVPLPLVEPMLAQLVNGGYLAMSESCTDGCNACSLAQACNARPGGLRFWTLTTKGLNTLGPVS